MTRTFKKRRLLLTSVGALIGLSGIVAPALAQGQGVNDASASDEIIVTARKRDETLLEVPVVVSAITGSELERRGIASIDALARAVPGLMSGEGSGTLQGGTISLRGISGTDNNPFADQAVSFNIDGVSVARATVRRMAEMDIAQVEVLRGPQALFFGKNSPGGIVVIHSADPTRTLSAKMSVGYEAVGREWRGEGYVAGPITETLGFRLAGYGSTMKGWAKSVIPANAPYPAASPRAPQTDEYAVRGTLKFTPSDRFDARLKLSYNKRTGAGGAYANYQFVNCPTGSPQTGGIADNCVADDKFSVSRFGPGFDAYDVRINASGQTSFAQSQILAGLEMNYSLTDNLKLTSITGFYKSKISSIANGTGSYILARVIGGITQLSIRETSQELRLSSEFDGPVNFVTGGTYQDSFADTGTHAFLGADAGTAIEILEYYLAQKGSAYSLFGSVTVDLMPTIELAGGARYSHEKKKLSALQSDVTGGRAGLFTSMVTRIPSVNERTFNNLSPEVTISWRPSKMLTAFVSYKEAFLSGGFNSGSADFVNNLTYDQETIAGWEAGLKSSLFDGALRADLAVYSYELKGLQVGVNTDGLVQALRNAGQVSTKGAEFSLQYRTPVPGLSLSGAIAYNKGRYDDYQASCYRGQNAVSPHPCLNQLSRVTNKVALLQDLSGTELLRAPEWTGNVAFDYQRPVGDGLKFGVGGIMSFSDSYLTDAASVPGARQRAYTLFDATVRLMDEGERWEIAFIGRNLTDRYYWTRSIDNPFSGTAPTGTEVPGRLGDTAASISRGRELMFRVSYKFGG